MAENILYICMVYVQTAKEFLHLKMKILEIYICCASAIAEQA